jgi:hypothetical protein
LNPLILLAFLALFFSSQPLFACPELEALFSVPVETEARESVRAQYPIPDIPTYSQVVDFSLIPDTQPLVGKYWKSFFNLREQDADLYCITKINSKGEVKVTTKILDADVALILSEKKSVESFHYYFQKVVGTNFPKQGLEMLVNLGLRIEVQPIVEDLSTSDKKFLVEITIPINEINSKLKELYGPDVVQIVLINGASIPGELIERHRARRESPVAILQDASGAYGVTPIFWHDLMVHLPGFVALSTDIQVSSLFYKATQLNAQAFQLLDRLKSRGILAEVLDYNSIIKSFEITKDRKSLEERYIQNSNISQAQYNVLIRFLERLYQVGISFEIYSAQPLENINPPEVNVTGNLYPYGGKNLDFQKLQEAMNSVIAAFF